MTLHVVTARKSFIARCVVDANIAIDTAGTLNRPGSTLRLKVKQAMLQQPYMMIAAI